MKECSSCHTTKPKSEFQKNSAAKDGLAYICKSCKKISNAKSHKKHYSKNKQKITQRSKDRRVKYLVEFKEWKAQLKCKVCGESEIVCLDFHHNNPTEKEMNIGTLAGTYSTERLKEEAKKCTVLCSNCHRKVHAGIIDITVV